MDLVPDGQHFLFELLNHREDLTPEKLRYLAGKRLLSNDKVEKLINVMVWNGSLGVRTSAGDKYIFNTGYKRQYLASMITADRDAKLILHPTLCAAI